MDQACLISVLLRWGLHNCNNETRRVLQTPISFFLCIHLHAVRESTENCVQICDFCQKFLGQPDEEPSFESIFVFSLWNIYALEKYPGVKKKNRVWGLIDKGKLNCTSNITACQLPAFHREFRIERQDGIMLW